LIELSQRQQLTVAAAITIVATLVVVGAIAGVFYLVGVFFAAFANVFLPLAVAGVLALVVRPYYSWLRKRLRMPAVAAVAAVFVSILVPVVVFAWTFGSLIVDQAEGVITSFPGYWERFVSWVQERSPRVIEFIDRYELRDRVQTAVQDHASTLFQGLVSVGGGAVSVGRGFLHGIGAVFTWAMLPVYFAFFLLTEPGQLGNPEQLFPFLKAGTRRNLVYLIQEFVKILVAFFRGQLVIAFLQGLLFALGFSIVGLRYGFLIGLALGFLNVIPYLGSIVGLGVALPLAFLQDGGGLGRVAAVLVVFTVVQMIEGYVLTPKIMGDSTGLHPMVIIVAIFFWGSALGGIAGMILAIPLTAFLVVFWRLARDHYIAEVL